MLIGVATPNAGGIYVYGDFWDLKDLHTQVHELVRDANVITYDQQETLYAFPHEIRKAYEECRETRDFGFDDLDTVTYRGTVFAWPAILFYIRQLRCLAAWGPTGRAVQAALYRLEALVDKALKECAPEQYCQIVHSWECIDLMTDEFLGSYISEVVYEHLFTIPIEDRFKELPGLLNRFRRFSVEHDDYSKRMWALAREKGAEHPDELFDAGEWPEPTW